MDARTLHAIIPIALVAGLALAGYTWYESVTPAAQGSCTVNSFFSCQKVDQSSYTTTFGVQDYFIGIGGYLILLAIDVPLLRTYRVELLYLLLGFSALGVAASCYFAYVELALIHAICPVCFSSYLPNAVVLAVGLALLRKEKAPDEDKSTEGRR